jgi:hypothetical protein
MNFKPMLSKWSIGVESWCGVLEWSVGVDFSVLIWSAVLR